MKKSDLKTGMWIEFRNGHKAMVLLNSTKGNIYTGTDTWGVLDCINDDLTYKSIFDDYHDSVYDIVKVYDPTSNMNVYNFEKEYKHYCIWERKEEVNPINITINATFNSNSDIDLFMKELKNSLANMNINLQIK